MTRLYLFYYLTKRINFIISILTCSLFNFILGNIAEGGIYVSTLPDQLLDQQPPIKEIATHARTAEWEQLGVELELNDEDLAGCHNCTRMYQLWIQEKAENATRRNLISALRGIRQNNVAKRYEDYLKTVSE